jgi:hypothetical protein
MWSFVLELNKQTRHRDVSVCRHLQLTSRLVPLGRIGHRSRAKQRPLPSTSSGQVGKFNLRLTNKVSIFK